MVDQEVKPPVVVVLSISLFGVETSMRETEKYETVKRHI